MKELRDLPNPLITLRQNGRVFTLAPDGEVWWKENSNTSHLGSANIRGRVSLTEFYRMIGVVA